MPITLFVIPGPENTPLPATPFVIVMFVILKAATLPHTGAIGVKEKIGFIRTVTGWVLELGHPVVLVTLKVTL